MNTIQAAIGKWTGILVSFGIDQTYLTGKHAPCPLCGGRDRFRYINPERGKWVCNQCRPEAGDGFDLLTEITGKSFKDVAREVDEIVGTVKAEPMKKQDPLPRLNKVAGMSRVLTGEDPATEYLSKRGIYVASPNIRYIPSYGYYTDGRKIGDFPVMVSRVQDIAGNRVSFHLTYLHNGEKAKVPSPKKVLPPSGKLSGCGVYLGAVSEHMLIGEGIETVLAGMQLSNIPGVAAISATMMEKIELPEGVRRVTVLADADLNYTGQKSAFVLANRLSLQGLDVEVKIPEMGTDFADKVRVCH